MSNGYDRFAQVTNGNKFFTDATGALRGVILSCTDNASSGIAVRASGHKLIGEAFAYYTDANGIMRNVAPHVEQRARDRNPAAFAINSRDVLDYIERCHAH
jgi:hypothetical protein